MFGSYTYQVLTGPRVGSMLFHMSIFYWHMCLVVVGSCITSSLNHVLYFCWSMWHDHNTLRVFLLLDHVSWYCTSACRYFIGPRVAPWATTCLFLIRPHGRTDLYHVFSLDWPTCPVLALTHVILWFIHVSDSYLITCLCRIYHVHTNHYIRENDFRSTLLHKMTTCIIILNLNQITVV